MKICQPFTAKQSLQHPDLELDPELDICLPAIRIPPSPIPTPRRAIKLLPINMDGFEKMEMTKTRPIP